MKEYRIMINNRVFDVVEGKKEALERVRDAAALSYVNYAWIAHKNGKLVDGLFYQGNNTTYTVVEMNRHARTCEEIMLSMASGEIPTARKSMSRTENISMWRSDGFRTLTALASAGALEEGMPTSLEWQWFCDGVEAVARRAKYLRKV